MIGKTTLLAVGIVALLACPVAADLIVYAPSPVQSGLPAVPEVEGVAGEDVTVPFYLTATTPSELAYGLDVEITYDWNILSIAGASQVTLGTANPTWTLYPPNLSSGDALVTFSGTAPVTAQSGTALNVLNVTFHISSSATPGRTPIGLVNYNDDPGVTMSGGSIAIPEPSSLALLVGLLLSPLAWLYGRRRKA